MTAGFITKDTCGCMPSIHVGPHWLYMDWFDKRVNGHMLEQDNPWGFITEDKARLDRKMAEMMRLGMDKEPTMTVWEALLREGWDPTVLCVAHHQYNPGKPLPGVLTEAENAANRQE